MAGHQREQTILYVDDEPANLTAFRYCFGGEFKILTARSGAEALTLLASEPVAVLLTDQRMPAMGGAELCARVREQFPDVIRMIVTAYADIQAAVAAINSGQVSRYILKPWREEDLATTLRAGIDAYQLGTLVHELQVRLLKSEQRSTTTFLLGRVLHELANPVAAVHANVAWLADTVTGLVSSLKGGPAAAERTATELQSAALDALEGVREVRTRIDRFRRGETPEPRPPEGVDLSRAAESAMAIVRGAIRKRAHLLSELGEVPRVAIDATQVSQVLVNLLINASEAVEPERPDENQITVRTFAEGAHAILEVKDTGTGIPADILPHIFEPYFSSKGPDSGRGIGLAIVRDIVDSAGGEISVRSEPGTGTTFTVRLPLAAKA